ncbi:ABC transporter ATP-binding protein [Leucobacter sp.]
MSDALLVQGVSVRRGGLPVCRDVSFTVPAGEITVLLGANGAGKSTLLDGISGLLPLAAGRVEIDGRRIDGLPVHRRAARGLAYVQQERSVFASLTVAQNLAVVDGSRAAFARACELFPRLAAKRDTRAGLLSGGEQQMLLVARALAGRPRFLLVDELSLGLGPSVVTALVDALAGLARKGVGILLVEQFVETALRVGTTAHILERGRVVRSAPCGELLRDRASLISPYLGGGS